MIFWLFSKFICLLGHSNKRGHEKALSKITKKIRNKQVLMLEENALLVNVYNEIVMMKASGTYLE